MNYLQLNDSGKLDIEEKSLAEYFGEGNYTTFYSKKVLQDKLKITKGDFIAGEIPVMFAAMRQLGIAYSYDDYPESLRKYLYRKIWVSNIKTIKNELFNSDNGFIEPVFIKPKGKLKKFTGFVLSSIDDLQYTWHAGNSTELYCSEPVIWRSEFRCPVINGQVKGRYIPTGKDGTGALPDMKIVQKMADDFTDAPKAYSLDVGVLNTGETALIEVNDGFSLGKYNMPVDIYANVLLTRWNELIGNLNEK